MMIKRALPLLFLLPGYVFTVLNASGIGEVGDKILEVEWKGGVFELPVETVERVPYRLKLVRAVMKSNPEIDKRVALDIVDSAIKYSDIYDLSAALVVSVIIVESKGVSTAVSPKGAVGLMQVMPYMADYLGFEGDLFDVDDNIRLGTFILADNIRRWGRSEGIERYFWGASTIHNSAYLGKVDSVLTDVMGAREEVGSG